MPLSNDNQDYGKSDDKNKQEKTLPEGQSMLSTDDLKGKKVDADLENDKDKPAAQTK